MHIPLTRIIFLTVALVGSEVFSNTGISATEELSTGSDVEVLTNTSNITSGRDVSIEERRRRTRLLNRRKWRQKLLSERVASVGHGGHGDNAQFQDLVMATSSSMPPVHTNSPTSQIG